MEPTRTAHSNRFAVLRGALGAPRSSVALSFPKLAKSSLRKTGVHSNRPDTPRRAMAADLVGVVIRPEKLCRAPQRRPLHGGAQMLRRKAQQPVAHHGRGHLAGLGEQ